MNRHYRLISSVVFAIAALVIVLDVAKERMQFERGVVATAAKGGRYVR